MLAKSHLNVPFTQDSLRLILGVSCESRVLFLLVKNGPIVLLIQTHTMPLNNQS